MPVEVYALQQQRSDTAANWLSNNPVLLEGEIGYEIDTGKLKVGDGTTAWSSLQYGPSISARQVVYTTGTLEANATEDFTITGSVFHLLSMTASTPTWVRVYGTSAARAADLRLSPGGSVPASGTEYYAELVTTAAPQTIRLSPVALVQGTGGSAFVRVRNQDTVARTITLTFTVLPLER